MAFSSDSAKGSSSTDKGKQPPKRSIGQIIDFIAKMIVLVVGMPSGLLLLSLLSLLAMVVWGERL